MKTTLLTLVLTTLFLIGCRANEGEVQRTERIYLRQMKTSMDTTTKTSGSFFILFGGFSSETKKEYKVRTLGNYYGEYRFMDLDLNKVTFKFDSTVNTPYIVVEYERSDPYKQSESFEYLFQTDFTIGLWRVKYVITCNPNLVPEELSQVKL